MVDEHLGCACQCSQTADSCLKTQQWNPGLCQCECLTDTQEHALDCGLKGNFQVGGKCNVRVIISWKVRNIRIKLLLLLLLLLLVLVLVLLSSSSSLKTQQRFSFFGTCTCFDVSNIVISHCKQVMA